MLQIVAVLMIVVGLMWSGGLVVFGIVLLCIGILRGTDGISQADQQRMRDRELDR